MTQNASSLTKKQLASFLDVSVEMIDAWEQLGVGPSFYEETTPAGSNRFYTAEAVSAFCLKHRAHPRRLPAAASPAHEPAETERPIVGGGVFDSA